MQRVAVFVDAGYFWVQACSQVLGARGARHDITLDYAKMREAFIKEVSDQFPETNLLRVYWYDGPGPQGKTADHRAIDELDDFKLRMGTRNGAGQQKAVDGLIIADMVSLTQSKAITDALLVTGDADLTPGVVAAQAMGLRVHLLTIGTSHATSPHIAAEVDRKVTWPQATVDSFAKRVNPQPAPSHAVAVSVPGAPLVSVAAAVVPAAQAVSGAQLDSEMAAKATHTSVQAGVNSALLVGLTATSPIPREIDRELLETARRQLGRSLNEPEKRALRAEFKKLL
jgi:uncharacterized LabA/DUF88 family protein